MSRLPYTADEISDAVRAMVALWMDSVTSGRHRSSTAEQVFGGPVIGLELGGQGQNVHARAFATEEAVRAAVRDDFASLLLPKEHEKVTSRTFNLLMAARNPRLLFDFPRLRDLFVCQLIPTQVALDFDNPSFFSPARCEVIGPL
jgi:hypothetical protein